MWYETNTLWGNKGEQSHVTVEDKMRETSNQSKISAYVLEFNCMWRNELLIPWH